MRTNKPDRSIPGGNVLAAEFNKNGGGIKYSEEVALEICDWIASGKSLNSFCNQRGRPTRMSVYRWLAEVSGFREMYELARADQADSLADEMVDIADDPNIDAKKGRLMVDTRKWVASKMKPKKYGDRVAITGAENGDPIRIGRELSDLSDDDLKAIAASGLKTGVTQIEG